MTCLDRKNRIVFEVGGKTKEGEEKVIKMTTKMRMENLNQKYKIPRCEQNVKHKI